MLKTYQRNKAQNKLFFKKDKTTFQLSYQNICFQNVNRMSKIQSDRQEDIQFVRQTDRVTERQNDSMADSRAAKEPALV